VSEGLDLTFDPAQQAMADAVSTWCRDHCTDAALRASADRFPDALWHGVAELGVLALAAPEGEGGAVDVAAVMEALGAAAFPGPLAETFLAAQLLPAPLRAEVAAGRAVVAVHAGAPAGPEGAALVAWAPCAQVFLGLEGAEAWLAAPAGPIAAVATLGGEPWGRVALVRRESLGPAARARALGEIALAAWLAAAGRALVLRAAEHARVRKQFGRSIGSFQAVSHPLADASIALEAASTLARIAAWGWDAGTADAALRAAAARLSAARASRSAAHAAHQVFGASGITADGPAFPWSRRILQRAAAAPGEAPARAALLDAAGL
jgi:alkylation response protein AidB-like acyl-CoA dehydrogenase